MTGPFTVDSLSPHRVPPADEDDPWLGVGEDVDEKVEQPSGAQPVRRQQVEVEIKGVDIFDPTTGEIRSSTDPAQDIACWLVDTDYDEESFFVRHAYFLNGRAHDPYAALKRTLKAEVDEEAWASLYRTVSRPFGVPASGRIAVKVINHYGDEMMKVYRIPPRAN